MINLNNKIAKARASLIIDHPFFASLLLPMPITETRDIPTFATDGESIVYNPDWADTLTPEEITFVLAHEVLHCVFDHMGRRGNKTPNRWNQAADYVINEMLVNESIGAMPKGGLKDSALVKKGGETAEGVYKILPASSEKNEAGKKGGALDTVLEGKITTKPGKKGGAATIQVKPLDKAEKERRTTETKVKVIQATNAAKMQGRLSAGMARLVKDLVKPVVDWKEVLRRFLSDRAKVDLSFARPKRRFIGEDINLPSLTGQKLGAVTIAVDCSGSVNQELLNKFSAEINAIKQDVNPSKINVVYFDSEVVHAETFEGDSEVKLSLHGGGGTRFSPVFKYINAQDELPIACIFLTDLCCSDFGPAPEYPVLWAVLEKTTGFDTAPFGEILMVQDKGD